MYSIKRINAPQPKVTTAFLMEEGDIGTMRYGNEEHIVLKAFNVLVSLSNPGATWSLVKDNNVSIDITLLPKGEVLTLEIL